MEQIDETQQIEEAPPSFEALDLPEVVLKAVKDLAYTSPTPIQHQAIPCILEGRDMIGSAQTGTGKTAAFTLPVLARLKASAPNGPRALILAPTRELAHQIDENLNAYGKYMDFSVALLYGGVAYGPQLKALDAGVDIVVATPGRLLDHIQQGNLNLGNVEILILDEVDRMLDMGFIDQVSAIVKRCPKERQTLLFSATVPSRIQELAGWALKDPVLINVATSGILADTIDHAIFPIYGMQKYDLLLALLEGFDYKSVLVFTRTKRDADRLAEWLQSHDHSVALLHADRSQAERKKALEGFKKGEYDILVATDIASRGLDISGVSHVVNYNVPEYPEDYVHRIGRTGRASAEGEAYTLFSSEEAGHLAAIERYLGSALPRRKLEGFRYRIQPDLEIPQPVRRKRNRTLGARRRR